MQEHCEVCNDRGWIDAVVYGSERVPDGTQEVQRCDECMRVSSDEEAQALAKQQRGKS